MCCTRSRHPDSTISVNATASAYADRQFPSCLIGFIGYSADMVGIFTFPKLVNEKAARSAAGGVVVLCATYLVSGFRWLLPVLAIGFLLRVAAGPRFSPLGRLAVHVIAPRFGAAKMVPGPPKRFAQGIGATLSVGAVLATFGFHSTGAAWVLIAMILVAASLEAFAGICLGCIIFAQLMKYGVIPADVCESCNDITDRLIAARNAKVAASS
jgi:Domain of unknown function (DUF4395)